MSNVEIAWTRGFCDSGSDSSDGARIVACMAPIRSISRAPPREVHNDDRRSGLPRGEGLTAAACCSFPSHLPISLDPAEAELIGGGEPRLTSCRRRGGWRARQPPAPCRARRREWRRSARRCRRRSSHRSGPSHSRGCVGEYSRRHVHVSLRARSRSGPWGAMVRARRSPPECVDMIPNHPIGPADQSAWPTRLMVPGYRAPRPVNTTAIVRSRITMSRRRVPAHT